MSITVTAAILALWLKHRVKHISSRFLPVQQKSPDRPAAPPPLKWLWYLSWFSLWLGPVLCFHSAFLLESSYFFSLTWTMVGHVSALLLLSVLLHCLQFEFERIWPGESRSFLSLNNSQINLTPSHSTVRQSDQHLYATYESLYHSHGYPLQSQTFTSVCIFL